ncbi:hypothetical protein DFH06DRAFT_1410986 [Mycena polygramma]|nr:hypothetical protein DFH06DRAFT_1410986 [Mycena polygramma]
MLSSMIASSSSELEALVLSSANPAGDIRPCPIMSLASSSPSASISAPVAALTHSDGLLSYTHVARTRRRLGSIPEEEVECKFTSPSMKTGQHADLGRNLAAEVRKNSQCQKAASQPPTSPIPSPRTAAPLKSRLKARMQKLFNTRKFAKRTLQAIPEARFGEPSEGAKGIPNGAKMSSVMLLAAQSILEEDRKLRKKERVSEAPGSSTVRLATQVLQVQEEQRKERKQARLEKLGAAPKNFVLCTKYLTSCGVPGFDIGYVQLGDASLRKAFTTFSTAARTFEDVNILETSEMKQRDACGWTQEEPRFDQAFAKRTGPGSYGLSAAYSIYGPQS